MASVARDLGEDLTAEPLVEFSLWNQFTGVLGSKEIEMIHTEGPHLTRILGLEKNRVT